MEKKTEDEQKQKAFEKGEISIRKSPTTCWWHVFDGERDTGMNYHEKGVAKEQGLIYARTMSNKYVGEQPWNKDEYYF